MTIITNHRVGVGTTSEASFLFSSNSETVLSPYKPEICPYMLTQSNQEAFFQRAIDEGLIDDKGNCLFDASRYPIPSLSEGGLERLNERLERHSGTVVKSLLKFPEWKISIIKSAYEHVSAYCLESGIENPFRIDFEKMAGEIRGLSFSLRAFLGYLIIVKSRRIKSIKVEGGDLVYICGGSFYLDAVTSLKRQALKECLDPNFLSKFEGAAPDFDIKVFYPVESKQELEDFIDECVFGCFAKKLFVVSPDDVFKHVKLLIRELGFAGLRHTYDTLGGELDHFYFLSFKDDNGMKIDMKFVSSQVHKQLFHAHGLSLEIMDVIKGSAIDLNTLVPYGECCGGWQAIFDRLGGIINVSRREIPFINGRSRFISNSVRGYRCVDRSLEALFLNQSDMVRMSPDDLIEEMSLVVSSHNRGRFEALFSALFMASLVVDSDENGSNLEFLNQLWKNFYGRYADILDGGTVNPICRIFLQMLVKGQLAFAQAVAVLEVIFSFRMAQPGVGIRSERLVEIAGTVYIQYQFDDDISLRLPFDLEKALSVVSEMFQGSLKSLILEALCNGEHHYESHASTPAPFSLYTNLGQFISGKSLRILESWLSYNEVILDKIFLSFYLNHEVVVDVRFDFLCGIFGRLLMHRSYLSDLLPYFELFDTHYSSPAEKIFKSLIKHLRKYVDEGHKSSFNQEAGYAMRIYEAFFLSLIRLNRPEIDTICFNLIFGIDNEAFRRELANYIINNSLCDRPIIALTFLYKLLASPKNVMDHQQRTFEILDVLLADSPSDDLIIVSSKILMQVLKFRKFADLKKSKRNLKFVKEETFYQITDFLVKDGRIGEAYHIFVKVIRCYTLRKTDTLIAKLFDILFEVVSQSHTDFGSLIKTLKWLEMNLHHQPQRVIRYNEFLVRLAERLFASKSFEEGVNYLNKVNVEFIGDEIKRVYDALNLRYREPESCHDEIAISDANGALSTSDLQEQSQQSLTINFIRESLDKGEVLQAKEACLKVMSRLDQESQAFKEVIKSLLEILARSKNDLYLYQILSHTKLPSHVAVEDRQHYMLELVKMSESSFDIHIKSLIMYLEEDLPVGALLPYLHRQLECVPLEYMQEDIPVWRTFKSELEKKQEYLFATLAAPDSYFDLIHLAYGFYLWKIPLNGQSMPVILDALVSLQNDTPLAVIYNILWNGIFVHGNVGVFYKEPYKLFISRLIHFLIEENKFQCAYSMLEILAFSKDNEEEINCCWMFNLLQPLVDKNVNNVLPAIVRGVCVRSRFSNWSIERVFELYKSVYARGNMIIAIQLLNAIESRDTAEWLDCMFALLQRPKEISEELWVDFIYHYETTLGSIKSLAARKVYLEKLYENGLSVIETDILKNEVFLMVFLRLREALQREVASEKRIDQYLHLDIRLINFCAASGSSYVMIESINMVEDMLYLIAKATNDNLSTQCLDPDRYMNRENVLLDRYQLKTTKDIHRALVNYLKRCFELNSEKQQFKDLFEELTIKILVYINTYCHEYLDLSLEICLAFTSDCSIDVVQAIRPIFFDLIRQPLGNRVVPFNHPTLVMLMSQILTHVIDYSHNIILQNPSLYSLFDHNQICEFWFDYFVTQMQFQYFNPQKDETDIIYILAALFEILHLFKSNQDLLDRLIDNLWDFIIYAEYMNVSKLSFDYVFKTLAKVLYFDLFPKDMPAIAKIYVLENPTLPVNYKVPGKNFFSSTSHIKSKKIQDAAKRYLHYQHQFCLKLLKVQEQLKLISGIKNKLIKTNIGEYIIEGGEDKQVMVADVDSFTGRLVEYLYVTIMAYIIEKRLPPKELSSMVRMFIYIDLPSRREDIYQHHLIQSIKLFRQAIDSRIFRDNIVDLCWSYVYCAYVQLDISEGGAIQNDIVGDALCTLITSGNIYKINHAMMVLSNLSLSIWKNQFVIFKDLFVIILSHLVEKPYNKITYFTFYESEDEKHISNLINLNFPTSAVYRNPLKSGFEVRIIPLYQCIGFTLIRQEHLLYSKSTTLEGRQMSLFLLQEYVTTLFKLCRDSFAESLDYTTDHPVPFLCCYLSKVFNSSGYDLQLDLFDDHVKMLQSLVVDYMKDPRLEEVESICSSYEALLLARPVVENVHKWLMMLLQSENLSLRSRGKKFYEQCLRKGVYNRNRDLSEEIVLALKQ